MKSNKNIKHILSILLFAALIAITFYLIFHNQSLGDIKAIIFGMKPAYIIAGILCMILCVSCEGECTRQICGSLGYKITPVKALAYACSDYYFSAITPSATGGQPAMAYYMSKDNIPLSKSGISLLLTLVAYMGSLIIIGVFAFFYHMSYLWSKPVVIAMLCIGIVLSGAVIAASLAAMFAERLAKRAGLALILLGAKLHLVRDKKKKTASFLLHLEEYRAGAEYVKTHPLITVRVTLICIIQRIALFAIAYFVYRGMGLNRYSAADIIMLYAIVMLSVTTLPVPGGVGVSEWMFMVVFANVFPSEMLATAMLLTRGINFYFCLVFAGTVTLVNHLVTFKGRGGKQ